MNGDSCFLPSRRLIRILRSLVLPVVLTGCVYTVGIAQRQNIRVLSYNIHHGEGVDKQLDLKRIADVIKSVSPDIVSLQEVDNKVGRSNRIDQAKAIAALTCMNYVYGASMDFQDGKYGNAVLTKLAIVESKVVRLPGEPRSALCVTLEMPDKESSSREFLFIATHLDTGKDPRLASVPLIEELFDSDKNLPAILAGDFNATSQGPTMSAFRKTWKDATSHKGLFTYPAKNPQKQIDYLLCRPSKSWKTVECKVLDDAVASDHRPIFAVLQLVPETKKKGQSSDKR